MRMQKALSLIAANALLLGALAAGSPAQADEAGVKIGMLSCHVSNGWGFVFASTRDLNCIYSPVSGKSFDFVGHISQFGADIGYVGASVLVWTAIAPTPDIDPMSVAGDYAGVAAGAPVGAGLDANVLVGGTGQTLLLQPLSIEGNTGLNAAAAIAAMNLQYQQPQEQPILPPPSPPQPQP